MKSQEKNIVILVLALIIIVGGIIGGNSYWNYHKNVNRVLNYSIYSSLNMTQHELLDIRTELEKYNGTLIGAEEFKSIVAKSRNYFFYGDYTKKYDNNLGKQFDYINYAELNFYMTYLSDTDISAKDIEFHKENLMKIIKLWAPLTVKANGNYLEPTPQLKKLIEETNKLAETGNKRIEGKQ
jgi:hypothetical protein